MIQNKEDDGDGKYSWWIDCQKKGEWIQFRKSLDAQEELSTMKSEPIPCTKLEEKEFSAVNDKEEDFKPDYNEWLKRKEWNTEQTAALFAGIDPDQLDTVKKMVGVVDMSINLRDRYNKYLENLSEIAPVRAFHDPRKFLPPYKVVPWARQHLTDIPRELKEIDNEI